GPGAADRGAGLRAVARGPVRRRDDSPRRPERHQGRRDLRLPLHARDRPRAPRGAAPGVRRPAARDHPRLAARRLIVPRFVRRVGWCLLAYAAFAWLPWAASEYHTHVLVTSLYYVLFLGLALAAILAARQIVDSRVGSYMRAIRDDEEAAAVMGVDTFKWKRFVFAVSAVFAAVAGGFQGHYVGLLSPTPMKFNEMAIIVVMVIVGGLRTFAGPIVGAVFIEVLSEALRAWGEVRMVLFALLVIVIARGYPNGLVGICHAAGRRLAARVPALAPVLRPARQSD